MTSDSHRDSQHKLVFSEIVASTITLQVLGALRLFQYECVIEHFANYPIKELTTLSLVAALAVVVLLLLLLLFSMVYTKFATLSVMLLDCVVTLTIPSA